MKRLSIDEFELQKPRIFVASPCGAAGAHDGVRRFVCGFGPSLRAAVPPLHGAAFYAPDYALTDPAPWWIPERFETITVPFDDWTAPRRCARSFSALERERIERDVLELTGRIRSDGWKKVVPVWCAASRESFDAAAIDGISAHVFRAPAAHSPYGLIDGAQGIIGATPELLFRVSPEGVIETMALAGTQPRTPGSSSAELLADKKERAEHQLVVEFLVDALTGIGEVAVGDLDVVELPHLRHLRTLVSVRPRERPDFLQLVRLLHPTPALGAVPREPGLAWLRARDGANPRGRHGAPFGVILPSGEMICVAAIRNLQWDPSGARIVAGCGIVAGSTPEREYAEASAKVAAVKALLGIES